ESDDDAPAEGSADGGEDDDDADREGEGDGEGEGAEGAAPPMPIAASAGKGKRSLADVARRQPKPQHRPRTEPARSPVTITAAAADIPGIRAGTKLANEPAIANAMHKRATLLRDHSERVPVATIDLGIPESQTVRFGTDPMPVIDRVRKDPASLAASGGWCGP